MIHERYEDYSVDMRTILAKERTLLAEQRTQLSVVAIGLGLFATGFTFLRVLSDGSIPHMVVEVVFLLGGLILVVSALLHYYTLGKQIRQAEKVERRLMLTFQEHVDELEEDKPYHNERKSIRRPMNS